MTITLDQLNRIMPAANRQAAAIFIGPLNEAMAEFGIDTPQRQAAFIAQIAHESGSLRYVRELASGEAYEGRADLGNTEQGDGVRFKGRGLIQITGRANYACCSAALYGDPELLQHSPQILERPDAACRSAAWFWSAHGLNELADTGDQVRICRRINGGLNGLRERKAFFATAIEVLT